jgi:predicted house-cleaning noncanonical NTP pyrophosphatase (MazG superfamily)
MEGYQKLVRDKIPEILDGQGIPYAQEIASPEHYRVALIEKLREEVQEFLGAESPEELADVSEVVKALQRLPEYANVEDIRVKKREERGGFDERIILRGEKD